MSASLVYPPVSVESLPRKRFTRQEVERLLETGFFDGQRWELIDGELIDKMGQKPPHAFTIQLVLGWLATFFPSRLIRPQLPIETKGEDLDRSVPEPDISVLIEDKPEYQKRFPQGDELKLAIEVSDSTAAFDLSRKAVLYASAGVVEYWVIDLHKRKLVIHRHPRDGEYRHIENLSEEDAVGIEGRSETVLVKKLLPDA